MEMAGSRTSNQRHRRDSDFSKETLDSLRDDVGNMCSLCERPTSGPSREANKRTNLGTGAHITAAARGGPRYDATLTTEQRRSPENGIWCCRDCGKLVDDDASTYTVARLQQIKRKAISRALHNVTVGKIGSRPKVKGPAIEDLRIRWEEELAAMNTFCKRVREHALFARNFDGWDTPFWSARKRDLQRHFGHCEWWVEATVLYKRWNEARRGFPALARVVRPSISTALQLTQAGEKLTAAQRRIAHVRRCLQVEAELEAITERDRNDAIRICDAGAVSPSGTYANFAKQLGIRADAVARRLAAAAWNFSCDAQPRDQDARAAELLRTGWLPSAEVMMIEGAGASPAFDRLRRRTAKRKAVG